MYWIRDIISGRVTRMSRKQRVQWLFGYDRPEYRRYIHRRANRAKVAGPCFFVAAVIAALFGDDITAWLRPIFMGGDSSSIWDYMTFPLVMAALIFGIGFPLSAIIRKIVLHIKPDTLI